MIGKTKVSTANQKRENMSTEVTILALISKDD